MEHHNLYQYLQLDNLEDIRIALIDAKQDCAYGDTYSISEIKKAVIQDLQPVFASLHTKQGNKTVLFVGADGNELIVSKDKDKEFYKLSDQNLKKAWTGEVIIITDNQFSSIMKSEVIDFSRNYGSVSDRETDNPVCKDFVIYVDDQDDWNIDNEGIKLKSKRRMEKINRLNIQFLPAHPVIVVFSQPGSKENKEGIRAKNDGIKITIYDPSDPYTEFLHELGHIYWITMLEDEERELFNTLQKDLRKDSLPHVFDSEWSWSTGLEVFVTLYMWYLKGLLSHKGYIDILKWQYEDGYKGILQIFNRVKDTIELEEVNKAQKHIVLKEWKYQEKYISRWLNNKMNQPSVTLIKGKGIRKSKIPAPPIVKIEFPEEVQHTVLGQHKERKWIKVDEGLLKGKILVLKGDELDAEYMNNKSNFYLIPMYKYIDRKGKRIRKTIYIHPDRLKVNDTIDIEDKNNQPFLKALLERFNVSNLKKRLLNG